MKKIYASILLVFWAALAAFAWFRPADDLSEAERRPLAQMPAIQAEAILNGSFMKDFEDYSLDQFPLRDAFRTLKSLFHYGILGQKDNNGIYLAEGYAVKQEYPLNPGSLDHALSRFQRIYEKYLADSQVYMAIVPDKGYYLAEDSGHLALDYEALFAQVREAMPWATHIDLTAALGKADYFRTDTHWRPERLEAAAQTLCQAMGVTAGELSPVKQERPFYGVYYGQAALPLAPEDFYLMEADWLSQCTVYDFETGKTGGIYDLEKLSGRDMYEAYLSGSKSLLTVENPNAATDRELLIFRDSFASALAPWLFRDYAKVTLIDIRYIQSEMLDRYLEFQGQDVLFLYSTLVLNSSAAIK